VTRRRSASERPSVDAALSYLRDVDTPVVLADVVDALELVTRLAEASGHEDLARAARHTQALAASLRAQFVSDLVGAKAPSETAIPLDRVRTPGHPEVDAPLGGGGWMQAAR
jgi:hypothetical protein